MEGYSQQEIDALFEAIYNGDINPLNLPEDLYLSVSEYLLKGMKQGFGEKSMSIEWGLKDEEMIASLTQNVYMFSAARTFQQTLEMSEALVDKDGELLTFSEFKKAAGEIYTRFNGGEIEDEIRPGWIEAEYNTAVIQAQNAKGWNDIERRKDVLPYLSYNAIDDACEICAPFNGITLPVDDPFWDENAPENHFNCRCLLEQLDQEEGESQESDEDDIKSALEETKGVPEDFKYNAGKKGELFSSEGKSAHPYFSVPKEYQEFAKENFQLRFPKK